MAKTYREFRELKEKRTKCNYLKKLSNVKVKVERRGEVFSMEKYMEERGMKREEEDIKKKEEDIKKKEKMMVMMMEPKNMGEEKIQHPKKKEPSSLEEEKDREMNSFLVKKNSRSVEGGNSYSPHFGNRQHLQGLDSKTCSAWTHRTRESMSPLI